MNIKLLLLLFLLPTYIFSQSISYDISEPIKANDNKMYGNFETGFVKITTKGKDIIVKTIDSKTLYINNTFENKDFLKNYFFY